MAINPELITTIRVDQLPDGTLNLTNKIPHTSGTVLEKASVQDLVDLVATAIGVSGGVGYIALSVTDGQQLPDVPELPSFFLCGAGTFLNINGYPNIICTENLNAIMSLTDHWELAVEIPINPLSGTVESVTGSAVDNTDPLNPVINEIISGVQNIVAGTNIIVDNTDPANPIVSATSAAGTPTLQEVTDAGADAYGNTINLKNSISSDSTIQFNVNDAFEPYIKIENAALGSAGYFTRIGSNNIEFDGNGDFNTILLPGENTNVITLPSESGTLALTSDITASTLQDVTDEGNVTTNIIRVVDAGESETNLEYLGVNFNDLSDGGSTYLQFQNTSIPNQVVEIRPLSGTMALLSDIPDTSGFVPYTGATTDVDLGEFELKAGQVELDQTPTGNAGVGVMRWNDTDGTADLGLKGGNVTLQIGQENVIRVVNKTATNINLLEANYQAVRVTGAQGQRLKVDLAQATNDVLSAETIGLVTETINNNEEGFITTSGFVRNINTTGSLQSETWLDGDILYLSPTTAGRVTNIKPTAPNHLVIIGYVVSAHATQGSIFVKVDNGYELDELHNVSISTPLNNQGLIYETSTDLWKNKTIIEDSITDGVTDKAPSQNAVFDALALKAEAYPNYPFNTTTNYFGLFDIVPTISTSVIIGSTANNTNNAVAFNRFSVDKEITINDFAILQNGANDGASATVTLYIFDDTNAGLPGVKLHQETTATGILTPAQKYISFTNNITLQKGNYWVALHFRGLNTAGTNPSFIGGLVNQPNVVTSIASYNINFRPLMTGATADLTNNPTITLGGFINFPQIFIKI